MGSSWHDPVAKLAVDESDGFCYGHSRDEHGSH